MNRLLLIIALMVYCSGAFANTSVQGNYRWRDDDGNEATATWKAAENTPISINNTQTLRLRIEQYNSSLGGALPFIANLEYSKDSITFYQMGTDADSPFYYQSSTQVADSTATTNQLVANATAATTTFVPGLVISEPSALPLFTLEASRHTEIEHVFRPGAAIATSTIYYFRHGVADYPNGYAIASTATALPVSLLSFTARLVGSGVHLRWQTASEHNNDRFEVMRSDDGHTWRCMATRKSEGATGRAANYEAYDSEPNGVAFYRLDQYDLDGTVMRSAIQTVASKTKLPEVTAYPNPMTGTQLNLHVPISAKADVQAVMASATGAVIYRNTIHTEPGQLDYTITLSQQPAPGVYYLQLKAQGLSRNVPILVK